MWLEYQPQDRKVSYSFPDARIYAEYVLAKFSGFESPSVGESVLPYHGMQVLENISLTFLFRSRR